MNNDDLTEKYVLEIHKAFEAGYKLGLERGKK